MRVGAASDVWFADGRLAMKTFDIDQRIEEIQLALAHLFESPKAPTVSVLVEGDAVFLHLTWVVESSRDTTLDSRCAATIVGTRAQIERYARLSTAQRREVQRRICECVRARYVESRNLAPASGACDIEVVLGDGIFDVDSDEDYFPTLE
jgi:hypothetical protein